LRERYRPERVRMLFVGESPPASGRFFYQADSGLYRAIRETFVLAAPALAAGEFLAAFRELGCYLVDLCAEPVDRLTAAERRRAHRAGEGALARTIEQLRPQAIVTLLRSIDANVARAVDAAGWHGQRVTVSYPGRWVHHRRAFSAVVIPMVRRIAIRAAPTTLGRESALLPESSD